MKMENAPQELIFIRSVTVFLEIEVVFFLSVIIILA